MVWNSRIHQSTRWNSSSSFIAKLSGYPESGPTTRFPGWSDLFLSPAVLNIPNVIVRKAIWRWGCDASFRRIYLLGDRSWARSCTHPIKDVGSVLMWKIIEATYIGVSGHTSISHDPHAPDGAARQHGVPVHAKIVLNILSALIEA